MKTGGEVSVVPDPTLANHDVTMAVSADTGGESAVQSSSNYSDKEPCAHWAQAAIQEAVSGLDSGLGVLPSPSKPDRNDCSPQPKFPSGEGAEKYRDSGGHFSTMHDGSLDFITGENFLTKGLDGRLTGSAQPCTSLASDRVSSPGDDASPNRRSADVMESSMSCSYLMIASIRRGAGADSNSFLDGPWGTEVKERSFHVQVSDPETRTNRPFGKYTLYLVTGSTSSESYFSTRKRYSDFEWLRAQLVLLFPGMFVPPIPKKQTIGRFDLRFLESRRQGLEEFLSRVLNRPALAESSVFRSWLNRSEGGMESLRRDAAQRPMQDMLQEYQQMSASYFDEVSRMDFRPERFLSFKLHLQKHLATLSTLHTVFGRMASLNCSLYNCINSMLPSLTDFRAQDERLIRELPELMLKPRIDLTDVNAADKRWRSECPGHNYDIMQYVLGKEIDDTECILEALGAVDRLVLMRHQAAQNLEREQTSFLRVQRSTRGNWVHSLIRRRDKDSQLEEITSNIDRLKVDVQTIGQWIELARLLVVTREVPLFLRAKQEAYRRVVRDFSQRQHMTVLKELEVWRNWNVALEGHADDPCVDSIELSESNGFSKQNEATGAIHALPSESVEQFKDSVNSHTLKVGVAQSSPADGVGSQ